MSSDLHALEHDRVSGRAPGLSHGHISTVLEEGTVELWSGGHLLRLRRKDRSVPRAARVSRRGCVKGFSGGSRRRMLRLVNSLRLDVLPWFITLTLPDVCDLTSMSLVWKRFCMRFKREFPGGSFVWRREWAIRRSGLGAGSLMCHWHLLVFGVPCRWLPRNRRGKWVSVSAGRVVVRSSVGVESDDVGIEDRFREWLSRMWYDAVGSGNRAHFLAGTNCVALQKLGGVKYYVAKYAAKCGDSAGGRCWGVHNRCCLPWADCRVFYLNELGMVALLRWVRHYLVSQSAFVRRRWNWRSASVFVNNSDDWLRAVNGLLSTGCQRIPY